MSATLDFLDRLVAFETIAGQPNLEMIAFVEDHLKRSGFATTRVMDPDGDKAGLFAVAGPPGDGFLLSAHTDVVPVAGQAWSKPPFRLSVEGERLYGRGTTDMKGFLASMLALATRTRSATLAEPLKFSISYDEEIGCTGIENMIDALPDALGKPRAAIVGEPTEMSVAIGHKGKVALRAVANGQAGHSANAPRLVSALHLADSGSATILLNL